MTFDYAFERLTGHPPFPWQRSLYDSFENGNIPPSCNLPTGLGKTSVVAIWLIALANGAKVPRRLAYVVNRRTVVDQTTAEVENLRKNLRGKPELGRLKEQLQGLCVTTDDVPLAISTLRGQFADNQQWSADPSRPAVICGTVDMIGSRLLFSGYRIGYRSRPLHAGFLGQDTLLVHDEAHLEPAFQRLVDTIQQEQRHCCDLSPLKVMELTATSRTSNTVFTLDQDDYEDTTVKKRVRAKKAVQLHPQTAPNKLADQIADLALRHKHGGGAILIFVRTVDDVIKVRNKLYKAKLPVEVLTGTLRGRERDELVKKAVFQRFLPHSDSSSGTERIEGTVYLVCTSAGEVGVDISADHMVCDLSTFDSMAQRFGRVNRFGYRDDSRIDVVPPEAFDEKDKLTSARRATLKLLEQLSGDASPQALAGLDVEQCKVAFAPEPTILPATDILFDAWALTTIRDKMPGRPPVELYLHGLAEWEPPRTSVAWRREVEYITKELVERHGGDFPQTLLDNYPLKPHELLNDTCERVFKALEAIGKRTNDTYSLWIVDERGETRISSFRELLGHKKRRVLRRISGCTILLSPATGGLNATGMLDATSDYADDVADMPEPPSERRMRRLRIGADELDSADKIEEMRLVRSIELDPDAEDEMEQRVWEWYKCKPLEDTRTAQQPVELGTHVEDVEHRARRITTGLSLPGGIAEAVVLAARLHDRGKQRERFQTMLGNRCYPDVLLAKSGRNGARLPESFRHEFASLVDAGSDEQVRKLPSIIQDLVLHLVAAHHGRARPHFPADEAFDPEPKGKDAGKIAVEVVQRFARLQRRYGRWGLAYLESLLRAADWAASADPSQFVTKAEEVSL